MLEKGKTYSWEDFWKYCQVGKTYKLSISDDFEDMPILDPNEKYIYVLGGDYFDIPYFYKASEFLPAFIRFLGDKAKDVLGCEYEWYETATYYECGDRSGNSLELEIYKDTIHELMEIYGVEDRDVFEQEYINKLPNIKYVYDCYDGFQLELDLEECEYFCTSGEHTLTINNKIGTWRFEVDGKGYVSGDDQNFWGIMDDIEVTVIDIL